MATITKVPMVAVGMAGDMARSSLPAPEVRGDRPPSAVIASIWLLLLIPVVAAGAEIDFKALEQKIQTPPPRPPDAMRLEEFRDEPVPPHPARWVAEPFQWAHIDAPPGATWPWTRWWWPGAAVDNTELRRELAQLHEAHFGGAEIQPFSLGVLDPVTLARMREFDTPVYYQKLRRLLEDAAKLGVRIDLTHLSGYPAGGPQVSLEDAPRTMAIAWAEFEGGQAVHIAIPPPEPTGADYAGAYLGSTVYFARGDERLLSVLVAQRLDGHLRKDPFDLRASLHLDPSTVHVVTGAVRDGTLEWDAPPGSWVLVASYIMPDPERPSFGAYQDPGYVVDALRAGVIRAHYNYAFGRRTGLPQYYGGALRGVFNDSLEFKANRLISADFLQEFRRRRGYDLEPYLPVVFSEGRDNFFAHDLLGLDPKPPFRMGETDERVRYDYQLTLSDLVIERFVRTSREWAEQRGLISRGQSFGADFDVLRALGENSIPEVESLYAAGGDAFLKLGSSAGALYGRNLVSAESFDWEAGDYMSTPGKIKAYADKLFLAGVNHIVYSGTPYGLNRGQEQPYGPQGWYPWSFPGLAFSDNFSPPIPMWTDVPALNTYIARVQNLLRQGKPNIDVLIYYPFIGFLSGAPGSRQKGELLARGDFPYSPAPVLPPLQGPLAEMLKTVPHAEHVASLEWLAKLQPVVAELDRRGITWGWINGDALGNGALTGDGHFRAGGRYGAVLFANVDSAPVADLAAAEKLAGEGAPVFIYGEPPQRQPGFFNAQAADAEARAIGLRLAQAHRGADSPEALAVALAGTSHAGATLEEKTAAIRRYSRTLSHGSIHFFANQTNEAVQGQLTVEGPSWWFDPLSGSAWEEPAGRSGPWSLALAAFESRILIVGIPMPRELKHAPPTWAVSEAVQTWPLEQWAVEVGDHRQVHSGGLFDWSKDGELIYAAGPGRYSTSFELHPESRNVRYVLDVGLVPGSATIRINGREAGSASLPPGRLDVTEFVKPRRNSLTITYTPPLRDFLVGRAMAGDRRYLRFKSEPPGAVVPAGLLSPITLQAYRHR